MVAVVSPYRDSGPLAKRAPKTPRLRLAWAILRGLSRRLGVRKIRHSILRDLPGTEWRLAHEVADYYPRESGAVLGLYIGYRANDPMRQFTDKMLRADAA